MQLKYNLLQNNMVMIFREAKNDMNTEGIIDGHKKSQRYRNSRIRCNALRVRLREGLS